MPVSVSFCNIAVIDLCIGVGTVVPVLLFCRYYHPFVRRSPAAAAAAAAAAVSVLILCGTDAGPEPGQTFPSALEAKSKRPLHKGRSYPAACSKFWAQELLNSLATFMSTM